MDSMNSRTSKATTRLRQWTGLVLGAALAGNGAVMLVAPARWYNTVPSVPLTGPLNTHFVRDIGCAYLLAGLGVYWGAHASAGPRVAAHPAAVMAALFLLMHAGVHLYETAIGLCGWSTWLRSIPTVTVPGLIAAWLAWPPGPSASISMPLSGKA